MHRGASAHGGQNRLLHPLELELHHLGTELRSCSKEVCTLSCQDVSPVCILFTYFSQCFCWVGSIDVQNQDHYDDVSCNKITRNSCFQMCVLTRLPFQIEPFTLSLLFLDILSSEINNKHGCNFHFLRRQLHITTQEKTTGLLIWSAIHHFLPVK